MKIAAISIMTLLLCGLSSFADARGLGGKYSIMQGTGDYASNGARAWAKGLGSPTAVRAVI
jgi:hypothetical protein